MTDFDLAGLELTHLRYFVVLAEELHFGRAAKRLHISQPPLTQQIQRLESRVGHALFNRTSRRTELSEAGRAFYDAACAVLAETQRAILSTRRVARGEMGQLTLATPPSLLLEALPKAILRFRTQLPSVEFRLKEMATSRIIEALESGSADLGLVRGPSVPNSLETLARWSEPIVAILPKNHAAAKVRRFQLKTLAAERFVFFPRALGPDFHEELVGYCRSAGFEPRIVQEATQWSSIVSLVGANMGVSIGPAAIARLLSGTVAVRHLPRLRTDVHLVRSPFRNNPAAPHFVEIVQRIAARTSTMV